MLLFEVLDTFPYGARVRNVFFTSRQGAVEQKRKKKVTASWKKAAIPLGSRAPRRVPKQQSRAVYHGGRRREAWIDRSNDGSAAIVAGVRTRPRRLDSAKPGGDCDGGG